MKSVLLSLVAAFALVQMAQADVTVKITKVHLCCGKCVKGAEKTVSTVDGVTAAVDKDSQTISLTAADTATVQKAVDALTKAGFFGETDSTDIKIDATTGATGAKVQSLKVQGVHLCCPSCVKAVHAAVAGVAGVTGDTAEKGVDVFVVSGDFTDSDVFAALQKAGLTGKVGN
jgi:periplasmic mercuric ion binding protein